MFSEYDYLENKSKKDILLIINDINEYINKKDFENALSKLVLHMSNLNNNDRNELLYYYKILIFNTSTN
jgi:ribosomal protein L31E